MKGYIGTPLDDSSGTIREMVINYLPSAHHTIRSAIEAMPHVDFILFDGPNKEEIDKMILEKGEKLYSPERRGFLEDWGKRLKNPRELFPFYADLCEKRKMMMLRGDISDEFMFLTYFLEMAALTHYRLNMEYEGLQDLSVREIEEEFPDQVEVISFGSVLGNYARDALIALKRGEDRVIIPANEGRFTDDFMAMKGMDYNGMADDPVWKRRGYKRGMTLK